MSARQLEAKISYGFLTHGPNLSDPQLLLTAANIGDKPVTISSGGLALPDGTQAISFANNSTERFPHELAAGKSMTMWFEVKPLAVELRSRGLSGKIKVRAKFSDQTSHDIIARLLSTAALALSCTGCVGLMIDKPFTRDIRNPVPLKATKLFGGPNDLDRWACQAGPDPSAPLTKDQFLASWGMPREKVATAKGETWIYAENGRWCGVWIFLIVPVPILLPLCETFDHVEFEGEVAVRSTSRRVDGAGAGLGFHPEAPLPVPFLIRPARVTGVQPRCVVSPLARGDLACF